MNLLKSFSVNFFIKLFNCKLTKSNVLADKKKTKQKNQLWFLKQTYFNKSSYLVITLLDQCFFQNSLVKYLNET